MQGPQAQRSKELRCEGWAGDGPWEGNAASENRTLLLSYERPHPNGPRLRTLNVCIIKVQKSSDNELLVEEGSLYPALQRLELNGWIDGVWGVTSNNRRARTYKITAAGRKQLAVETRKYAKLTLAIARVMGAE